MVERVGSRLERAVWSSQARVSSRQDTIVYELLASLGISDVGVGFILIGSQPSPSQSLKSRAHFSGVPKTLSDKLTLSRLAGQSAVKVSRDTL